MKILNGVMVSTIVLTVLTGIGEIRPIDQAYAASQDTTTKKQVTSQVSATKQLIIKFKNELKLPYKDGIEKQIQVEKKDSVLENIFSKYPNLTLTRLFTSVTPTEIKSLSKNKKSDHLNTYSNLVNYYMVETTNHVNVNTLLEKFKKSALIEHAYVQEKNITPPEMKFSSMLPNALNNPRFEKQGYLKEAPYGIDATYAWGIKGGDGTGVTFVDMEYGWQLNHEDLINQNVEWMSGKNIFKHARHGTSVLGIVSAEDNDKGNIGVSPKAKVKVISQIRDNDDYNTADAILDAVNKLDPGDVLLLEAQASYEGYGDTLLPVEVKSDTFDAIRAGTDKGIIIIEAGANGGQDLDQFRDKEGKQVLNRNSSDLKDSGAIIVGASSSTVPHKRLGFSNYGSRVDVYGWGENVDTLDADPILEVISRSEDAVAKNLYTSSFAGTSSASPIIAGAAASVQGIAKAHRGYPYTPDELRKILSNPITGTKSKNPSVDKIGVLPDLKAIISNLKL